ncbi:MAG: hypothetical protein FWD78_16330 [Treponema sp.]|nr:hypothetical protein [Treponema sp.]
MKKTIDFLAGVPIQRHSFGFLGLSLVFAAGIFFGCASAPKNPPPAWAADAQSVYPWDKYITGQGNGATVRDAEENATAEISLYFVRETTVERSRHASWTEQDGVSASQSTTDESVLVKSYTNLVAVQFADDPWYNPAAKTWKTLAYINREQAWAAYEPNAKRQADTFMNLVKAADKETEPFNAVLRYGAAVAYARGPEFNTVRDFSQVLNPAQANGLFAETDAALAALLDKQLGAQQKSIIAIQCPVDYNMMIYQSMVKALGASGFAVDSSGNAATICAIQVEEGLLKNDTGTFYTPSLTASFSGSSGAMFSFRVTTDRVGAINADVAKSRAYTALANALEGAFAGELQRRQSALIN